MIQYVIKAGRTPRSVATDFDILGYTVYNWLARLQVERAADLRLDRI